MKKQQKETAFLRSTNWNNSTTNPPTILQQNLNNQKANIGSCPSSLAGSSSSSSDGPSPSPKKH